MRHEAYRPKRRQWDYKTAAGFASERVRSVLAEQFGDLAEQDAEAQRDRSLRTAPAARPSARASAKASSRAAEPWLNVRPDPIDFRDRFYEPSLTALASRSYPEPLETRGLMVRDQGAEGSCTGQALAAVIDLQNIRRFAEEADVPRRVSARMLYESARAFDEFAEDGLPGSSLRGALKGFFHNGVCDALLAPYLDGDVSWQLTAEIAKDARRVGLGAYFRLRHVLNDYHAALNEAGAIFCSALIHKDWEAGKVGAAAGHIRWRDGKPARPVGMHAFAIVGYDRDGFIVLNSWGPNWGGFNPADSHRRTSAGRQLPGSVADEALPGMAHWPYDDWRANVVDAWALRLTAPTARPSDFAGGAFNASLRESGVSARARVPAAAIRGHYLNLDDGLYVRAAPYDNSRATFVETARFLVENEARPQAERYDHLLFYAHGGLNTLDDAAARAGAMTPVFKRNGVYPLFYLWHTGAMESLGDIVRGFTDSILARTRGLTDLSDVLIERAASGIGGPIWAEMKQTAAMGFDRSAAAGLEATSLLLEAAANRTTSPLKVHFVGHSAGAIFLGELFAALAADSRLKGLLDLTASVSLFAPACTTGYFDAKLAPMARRLGGDGAFGIYNLSDDAERRDSVATVYRKSLLYLVSNSFEPEGGVPLAGMTRVWQPGGFAPAGVSLFVAGDGTRASAATTHGGFDNDPVTMNHVLARIVHPRRVGDNGFSKAQLGDDGM